MSKDTCSIQETLIIHVNSSVLNHVIIMSVGTWRSLWFFKNISITVPLQGGAGVSVGTRVINLNPAGFILLCFY